MQLREMEKSSIPELWDGKASERIVDIIQNSILNRPHFEQISPTDRNYFMLKNYGLFILANLHRRNNIGE